MSRVFAACCVVSIVFSFAVAASAAEAVSGAGGGPWIHSAKSGPWSDGSTWVGGKVPAGGARVHVLKGHTVVYDVKSEAAIRALSIGGIVSFAPDRDTRLEVGVLKIQAGAVPSEDGFDCEVHTADDHEHGDKPALEVGTPLRPIQAGHTALIRLRHFEGHDPKSCPAVVCCGGRMDFHGAPLSRTWVKLGATAKPGDAAVTLSEPVTGWRVGDRVIVTATHLGRDNGQGTEKLETEERTIASVQGDVVTLDAPLDREHLGEGDFRGEIANLSRNVIVESADPAGPRGHTMYHRASAGSISYAEFRHLGKKDTLGRYALHYHLCGDTMRGAYVLGASVHDSHNRWLTIHGTNHLVVRDVVGCRSVGHGFYFEDGTEVDCIIDRNLAVQAMDGKRLPKQVLPFDDNAGAGFWWSNSRNTFTRNVTCENNRYGYFYEATESSALKLTLPVRQPDGSMKPVDVRTLPLVRFDDNEAHCDGLYGVNLGEGVNRVGPDDKHPFVLRNTKIWEIHYAFRVQAPCVLTENMTIHNSIYGVYHPNFDRHVYRNLTIGRSGRSGDAEPFNRGHDDDSVQYGSLAVDGLTFAGHYNSGMPLIQISDHNPTGAAESHFRNVKVVDRKDGSKRALVNLGGGPRPQPKTPTSVPVFIHDYYGPGRTARVMSARAGDVRSAAPGVFKQDAPLTGDESLVSEVANVEFPTLLNPVDDLPPTTVITHIRRTASGWIVRGSAADNGEIKEVVVNGERARPVRPGFAEWEAELKELNGDCPEVTSHAADAAGNVESQKHTVVVDLAAAKN